MTLDKPQLKKREVEKSSHIKERPTSCQHLGCPRHQSVCLSERRKMLANLGSQLNGGWLREFLLSLMVRELITEKFKVKETTEGFPEEVVTEMNAENLK